MGYVDVAGLSHVLPDGRELFKDVSFRVGEGAKVAPVGPNGAGKTTLLRMVAGDLPVKVGTIARSGGLGVMRQFIGMLGAPGDRKTLGSEHAHVRHLDAFALSLAAPAVRAAPTKRHGKCAQLTKREARTPSSPCSTSIPNWQRCVRPRASPCSTRRRATAHSNW